MNLSTKFYAGCFIVLSLSACTDIQRKTHGPIRLGDTASIVTEKDPSKLQDFVTDLKPVITPIAPVDTPKPTQPNTGQHIDTQVAKPVAAVPAVTTQPAATTPLPTGNGLNVDFKEISIFIPNIAAKQFGKANLQKENGAVYSLLSGQLPGNILRTKGNITKVAQRYQVIIVLRGKNGNLPLESLSSTAPWQLITGNNGTYPIKGLHTNELVYPSVNEAAIRNAVTKSARSRRLSRKKTEEWLQVLGRNIKSANQKPLEVTLRSVMWKLDGKDASGRMFSKQVRIDLPL
jgi:hypothetical protein